MIIKMNQEGFYAVCCKGCGMWGAKEVKSTVVGKKFTCKFCNKSQSIKKKSELGMSVVYKGPYYSASEVREVVLEKNMEMKK